MVALLIAYVLATTSGTSVVAIIAGIGGTIGGVAALITAFTGKKSGQDTSEINKFDKLTTQMDAFTERISADNEILRRQTTNCNNELAKLRLEHERDIRELRLKHDREVRELKDKIAELTRQLQRR